MLSNSVEGYGIRLDDGMWGGWYRVVKNGNVMEQGYAPRFYRTESEAQENAHHYGLAKAERYFHRETRLVSEVNGNP
ncbi:hypothetical protein [Dyella psychrodurans]|uniref:DUF2188 domain-containing protein n=1 Tax=Dyella psychrodurans TaxID=1927960 RepID=A0A370XDJ8_9GAMM|nr:hypothetical protein [Dyella psychrodurans]RDS86347.1 hypothetical protein DWU99_03570 [Dyella psychrodurans]